MAAMKLKSYFVTLLLFLISFSSAGFGNPLSTKTVSAWEAANK